jgi:streptogramin lyase
LFNKPTGIAIDSQENIYVFNSGSNEILKFDETMNLVRIIGEYGDQAGQFNCLKDKGTICGLAVDANDNLYVIDKGNGRIQKFDSDGNYLTSWGSFGTGEGRFTRPIYITVDCKENIIVSDDQSPIIQKFDSTGNFLFHWGSFGEGEGQFQHATGITVDSIGNIYISDYINRNIQKFDSNGNFLQSWKTGTNGKSGVPEAIAIDLNDTIYVTDSKLKQIQVFAPDGNTIKTIPLPGAGIFNRIAPYGIVISAYGTIFLSDRANDRVLIIQTNQ